ncbi:MAG: ABC transporter ATP-binding protein [Deltaproteobacteria bacterium]|nr:ABC transporter ATP-binding protein [Deltaproteobacteria bacterium]
MIIVDNVSKRFGAVRALDGVSLRLERGERIGIVGSNGSGKTTLLRAILGLVRVEGTVTIDGHDVARAPKEALSRVAYAPQIAPPIDAPVGELVRLQCTLRGLSRASVVERASRLGLDLDAIARTRFRDLSGGMKQKALASLALASDAPVLVCDEPTANLDAPARASFFAQVGERLGETTLVLCSHRADEVRHLVDRVVELRDGRVARDVPVAELMSDLRISRVEVRTIGGAEAANTWLQARGFTEIARGRFWGSFKHGEMLELVTQLMRDHGRQVDDLAIFDEGEIGGFAEAPASSKRRTA